MVRRVDILYGFCLFGIAASRRNHLFDESPGIGVSVVGKCVGFLYTSFVPFQGVFPMRLICKAIPGWHATCSKDLVNAFRGAAMQIGMAKCAGAAALTMMLMGASASSALAAIIFTPGNSPQPNEENILFGASESGPLIQGQTNGSLVPVYFSSLTSQTLNQASAGQADIDLLGGGLLTSLRITTVPATGTAYAFGDFIMNLQGGSAA